MRTAIVGVGNSLMRDEGIGIHVARALADVSLPEGTWVIDAGTDPDVAFDLDGFDRVIVVDAVLGGKSPGTVYRFGDEVELEASGGRQACHDVGLLEMLRQTARERPEVVILGVEPQEVDWGLDLTPVVCRSVPRVIEVVQQELRRP
jgi:hydrogenase maturation protease